MNAYDANYHCFRSTHTLMSFYRVDPNIGTDKVKESPVQRAAERDSVELLTLFSELAPKSAAMKIKLLKLIIDGEQVVSLETFKQQLESLSASEVKFESLLTIKSKLCVKSRPLKALTMLQVDQIDISSDGNLLHFAVIKDLKEHVRILLKHGLVLLFFVGKIEAPN